jgi:DNA modification methylase
MTDAYLDFLARKMERADSHGIDADGCDISDVLFPFQRYIVRWALGRGRAAIFAGCGLGKTLMQLEWARHISERCLIVAPLAVADQTITEAREKLGLEVRYDREDELDPEGIRITNYEHVHKFDAGKIDAVVLDESSILKAFMGKTKREIISRFGGVRYRLACTATPAPNDHMELGNHADFLGVMGANEMLSRWFINDSMNFGNYRLKGHAEGDFWSWVASWAVCCHSPADLGFDDEGYDLPPISYQSHFADVKTKPKDGHLFGGEAVVNATSVFRLKRETAADRARIAAEIANGTDRPVIVWVNTNDESNLVAKLIPDSVEVVGSQTPSEKARRLRAFTDGSARVMVTKPSIAGFGLNWQHCADVVFMGLTYSFEQFYQAVRRTWRFGQERPVTVHTITDAFAEGEIGKVVAAKDEEHQKMVEKMREAMRDHGAGSRSDELKVAANDVSESGRSWEMRQGDCVQLMRKMEDESVRFSVFSPPFSNLYIYSDMREDMGNAADDAEFLEHYRYMARELHRITLRGRLAAVHCKDLPRYRGRDGAAGLYDFPGELRRVMEEEGWQYHSRVTIWKCPVIEMQRTKNNGLLYKTLRADSSHSRQGMADYVIVFRKWVDCDDPFPEPVKHTKDSFPLDQWQEWASPVWMDIQQTDVLNVRVAREDRDEKHICPLQLDLVERCVKLWSNTGDLVFSPFAGIGSEGYVSVKHGRRFLGTELKPAYFEQAVRNLEHAESSSQELTLLDLMERAS